MSFHFRSLALHRLVQARLQSIDAARPISAIARFLLDVSFGVRDSCSHSLREGPPGLGLELKVKCLVSTGITYSAMQQWSVGE